jgi:hypothetical protein
MAIIDDADRHEIYLAKLTTQILNAHILPSLEQAQRAARMILLDAESIDSLKILNLLQKEIGKVATKALLEGWDQATAQLELLAEYEAGFSAKLTGSSIGAALAVPSSKQIQSEINKSIIVLTSGSRVKSGVWAEYVKGSIDAVVQQYNGIIVTGYQQGRTVGQMSADIKRSTEGLLRGQAEALVRTGQSHYANQAREAMAQANTDVIKHRVFVATFDNRTTLTCRHFAGRSWEINDKAYPRLPLHFGERSVYVYVNDLAEISQGSRSAVGGKQAVINPKRKLKYRGKKDADIFKPGQISAGQSMDSWMRNQPEWFQDSALGATRAKLFRDGEIKLDRFADATGKPITLDQLKELDAKAFDRAGL